MRGTRRRIPTWAVRTPLGHECADIDATVDLWRDQLHAMRSAKRPVGILVKAQVAGRHGADHDLRAAHEVYRLGLG